MVDVILRQQGDGFGIGIGLIADAVLGQKGAQFAEVFNNPVVHNRHAASAVRVRVVDIGCAMRGPTGVANAGLARKRLVHQ